MNVHGELANNLVEPVGIVLSIPQLVVGGGSAMGVVCWLLIQGIAFCWKISIYCPYRRKSTSKRWNPTKRKKTIGVPSFVSQLLYCPDLVPFAPHELSLSSCPRSVMWYHLSNSQHTGLKSNFQWLKQVQSFWRNSVIYILDQIKVFTRRRDYLYK